MWLPAPKARPHRPLTLITFLVVSISCPTNLPVVRLKPLMRPSPRFPTSRSLLNVPKFDGARASPQGLLRVPPFARVLILLPDRSKISTAPEPVVLLNVTYS